MKIKYISKVVPTVILCAALSMGCTSNSGTLQGKSTGYTTPNQQEKTLIVFYREGETARKMTKSDIVPIIFVDDHIIGSVLPGRYTQTEVCLGSTAQLRIDTRMGNVAAGSAQTVAGLQQGANFFKIVKKDDQFNIQPVTKDEAEKSLGILMQTSHIINRQNPSCKKTASQVTLGSDTLFKPDSSQLLPAGYAQLNSFLNDIKNRNIKIDGLKIVAHTDYLGNDDYNYRFSLERAESVAQYLKQQGLTVTITTEGRGEQMPVIKTCTQKKREELIACLQPNRRVVIELLGK